MRDIDEDTGAPRVEVARAVLGAGDEPPDVIEVVFPAGPTAPPREVGGPPSSRLSDRPGRRRADPGDGLGRPLLFGAVAIAAAGLAFLLAWTLWPQYPTAPDTYRPLPAPTYDPLALPSAAAPARKRPPTPAGAPHHVSPMPPAAPSGTTAVTTGTASPAAPAAGSPTATSPRTLRAGDTGPDVRRLQRLLFDQGLTYVSPTGVYDDATVRGVTQVQENRTLTCDPRGVYGPCTRAALVP